MEKRRVRGSFWQRGRGEQRAPVPRGVPVSPSGCAELCKAPANLLSSASTPGAALGYEQPGSNAAVIKHLVGNSYLTFWLEAGVGRVLMLQTGLAGRFLLELSFSLAGRHHGTQPLLPSPEGARPGLQRYTKELRSLAHPPPPLARKPFSQHSTGLVFNEGSEPLTSPINARFHAGSRSQLKSRS